jgi:hypothetical protein
MKIRARKGIRAINFIFTIHEKNRELVNLRSFLLEPPMQRVYHVVFANTFHNNVAQSRASRRNDRHQEERDREAFDLIVSFFEHASMEPNLVWPDVQLQLIEHRRRVASLSGNEGNLLIHRCG